MLARKGNGGVKIWRNKILAGYAFKMVDLISEIIQKIIFWRCTEEGEGGPFGQASNVRVGRTERGAEAKPFR